MRVDLQFYATLRDAVGEKTVRGDFDDGATVGAVLREATAEREDLESLLFRGNGELRPHITVARNGDPILSDPADAELSDGDTLVLSPGVSGGATVIASSIVGRSTATRRASR